MIKKILDVVKEYKTVIIHRHVRPDPDALGSQGGLADILQTTFPEKNIFVVGAEEQSLTFLNRMDEIPDHTYEGALVIICDTANQDRISDNRYKLGDYVIKIDHHPNDDAYGDLIWVDTEASSVSEMIYQLYEGGREQYGLRLTENAARLLYAGIVGDTGRFMFSSTTAKTFETAGKLRAKEFSIGEIYKHLYKTKMNAVRLKGYVLQHFHISSTGTGHINIDSDILKQFEVTPSEASLLVNAFSDVEGIKAWVFFIEEPDQIRVRLRSKGIIVNEIAKKYNGGGHPLASGATIHTWKEADLVLADLEEACERTE
jgi:phosphoesterase RecJ-like protein